MASLPDGYWNRQFRRKLSAWYKRNARDLPWRRTRDAYRVWVSEIMLQQTQVATVIPFFQRFLARFADIHALAAADEIEVLRLWEGLGYYRRARQLHAAARLIVERYGGEFPRSIDAALGLPGIGRYTAGAILSIAFDARHPILEANTLRLYSRLLALRADPLSKPGQDLLWSFARHVLPQKAAGTFNQALMELGSSICTPRAPRCDACPVKTLCLANQQQLQQEIPRSGRKIRYEDVREAAVVVRRDGQVLLRRCEPGQRWAGLWDFPRFPLDRTRGQQLRRELVEKTRQLTGISIEPTGELATIKHGVTRYRITLHCYTASFLGGRRGGGDLKWVNPSQLEAYPLSVSGRRISRMLE